MIRTILEIALSQLETVLHRRHVRIDFYGSFTHRDQYFIIMSMDVFYWQKLVNGWVLCNNLHIYLV